MQQMMKLERLYKLQMHGTLSKIKWRKELRLKSVEVPVLYQVDKNKELQLLVLSSENHESCCLMKQLLPLIRQMRD
jgi:hypothetical protein